MLTYPGYVGKCTSFLPYADHLAMNINYVLWSIGLIELGFRHRKTWTNSWLWALLALTFTIVAVTIKVLWFWWFVPKKFLPVHRLTINCAPCQEVKNHGLREHFKGLSPDSGFKYAAVPVPIPEPPNSRTSAWTGGRQVLRTSKSIAGDSQEQRAGGRHLRLCCVGTSRMLGGERSGGDRPPLPAHSHPPWSHRPTRQEHHAGTPGPTGPPCLLA